MTDTPDKKREDIATAAEHALGLLPDSEAAAFAARLAQEPELRALMSEWQEKFAGFTDDIDPVEPRAKVKAALEARLFENPRQPLLSRFGFWRGFAGVASIAAVVFALLFIGLQNQQSGTVYVAEIGAENGELTVVALFDPQKGVLSVNRTQGVAAENRSLELWLISGGNAPVSLGVLSVEQRSSLNVSASLHDAFTGAVLAISDEPAGGSPTGQPTGAVLATGAVADI